jgi:hypothetical protein
MNKTWPKQNSVIVAYKIRPPLSALLSRPSSRWQQTRRVWAILWLGLKKFSRIDGAQWAGAFAFNAFFSLFPLMLLLVTLASFFVDRDRAGKAVIARIESYVPISGELQQHIVATFACHHEFGGRRGATDLELRHTAKFHECRRALPRLDECNFALHGSRKQ